MKAYNKSNIPLAKELRKNMTPWERKLWYEYLRLYPVRFQRQKAIGNYIVDFYCAKARLLSIVFNHCVGYGGEKHHHIQFSVFYSSVRTVLGLPVLSK